MLDLSPLFFTTIENQNCLYKNLDLTPAQRDFIAHAKNKIRQCLRDNLPQALAPFFQANKSPKPRFFTQGSWAYKTLNAPAHLCQQADCDDGCYLPMSFIVSNQRPSVAAIDFFDATEATFKQLVQQEGWILDTSKDTCIRIIITDYAHIDIPLYAIPDDEFNELTAKAQMRGFASLTLALDSRKHDSWIALPHDKVLLAHRKQDWLSSDPRPLKNWFLEEVDARGEQLRRVVRYLKAFRDWTWKTGGPTSILLMAAAVPLFEKYKGRDDLSLLRVISKLPEQLRRGVQNPVDDTEYLTARFTDKQITEFATKFENFEKNLRMAIHREGPLQACLLMQQEFGPRFPNESSRVKEHSLKEGIIASAAVVGPSELVGRTKAGYIS